MAFDVEKTRIEVTTDPLDALEEDGMGGCNRAQALRRRIEALEG